MTAGGGLRSLPELTTVAQLLAGQEEALHLAAERCETLYECSTHCTVEESEFGEEATLLHSLLWSKLAPKYFLVTRTLLIHHLQDFCLVEEG